MEAPKLDLERFSFNHINKSVHVEWDRTASGGFLCRFRSDLCFTYKFLSKGRNIAGQFFRFRMTIGTLPTIQTIQYILKTGL